jgi:hypothetical protein
MVFKKRKMIQFLMEKVSFSSFREHRSESYTYHQLITGVTKIMCNTMYQTINLYDTKDQLCTTACTTTSASNMHQHLYNNKCINHAPTPIQQQVHQPCTKTYTMYLLTGEIDRSSTGRLNLVQGCLINPSHLD